MTTEKFTGEVKILKKFFELHCKDKHTNQQVVNKQLIYNNTNIDIELNLCDECLELINYSFDRLKECPHDPKPMCRSCPNPCYEKPQWKKVARLMRYSGMRLGMLKIRKFLRLS